MEISAQLVRDLREKTGAPVMDCKKALQEVAGDIEKAIDRLREKGLKASHRKAGRSAHEGLIDAYIHPGNKIGVMVEVNCETDFVARTEKFKELVRNLSMHIAATNPLYLTREEISPQLADKEREVYRKQALQEGKPEKIIEKIIGGRMEKFYSEVCLMEQSYVREPDITIKGLIDSHIGQLGENIIIRRFSRFQLGETA